MNLLDLPDDCLEYIFYFLERDNIPLISLVCTRFHSMLNNSTFYEMYSQYLINSGYKILSPIGNVKSLVKYIPILNEKYFNVKNLILDHNIYYVLNYQRTHIYLGHKGLFRIEVQESCPCCGFGEVYYILTFNPEINECINSIIKYMYSKTQKKFNFCHTISLSEKYLNRYRNIIDSNYNKSFDSKYNMKGFYMININFENELKLNLIDLEVLGFDNI